MASRYRHIAEGWTARLRFAPDDRLMSFVRRGDSTAFEILYDRHASELLSFCVYMLGSRQDAEDAVQATFASAYRVLNADGRDLVLRPWLFTVARNACLSILRKRRPVVEFDDEHAISGDPVAELELREEVRHIFESLLELPERQRAALVLAELHGLSQVEIGTVLGVRAEQVKAYIYQARSHLIADGEAREADCVKIREELSSARGAALLKSRLRRHIRACAGCRVYADGMAQQRRQLALLFPMAPSLALKYRVFEHAVGFASDPGACATGAAVGTTVAGAAAEIAGGGAKALVAKLATGVAVIGAGAGVGAAVLGVPVTGGEAAPSTAVASRSGGLGLEPSAGSAGPLGSLLGGASHGGGLSQHWPAFTPADRGSPLSALSVQAPAPAGHGLREPAGTEPDPGAQPSGGGEASNAGGTQERQAKHDERLLAREARQQLAREERDRAREEHLRAREEHGHGVARPPLSEEERLKRAEERQRRREEREHGVARPPLTEEEKRERREERQRKREEREGKLPPPSPVE